MHLPAMAIARRLYRPSNSGLGWVPDIPWFWNVSRRVLAVAFSARTARSKQWLVWRISVALDSLLKRQVDGSGLQQSPK